MPYRMTATWVDKIHLADGRTIPIAGLDLGRVDNRQIACRIASRFAILLKCQVKVEKEEQCNQP
jgi:hypothetical protein